MVARPVSLLHVTASLDELLDAVEMGLKHCPAAHVSERDVERLKDLAARVKDKLDKSARMAHQKVKIRG